MMGGRYGTGGVGGVFNWVIFQCGSKLPMPPYPFPLYRRSSCTARSSTVARSLTACRGKLGGWVLCAMQFIHSSLDCVRHCPSLTPAASPSPPVGGCRSAAQHACLRSCGLSSPQRSMCARRCVVWGRGGGRTA